MFSLQTESSDLNSLAKELVADIPLDEICQNQELMNAFLAEMFLAISKASTRESRKIQQAKGIAAARERGVKFGPKLSPLPDNFDKLRFAWRRGEYNLKQAAELCGMAKSTFYNAVQRAEAAEASSRRVTEEATVTKRTV